MLRLQQIVKCMFSAIVVLVAICHPTRAKTPAPSIDDFSDSSTLPSPAAPAPGGDEAVIKRSSRTCAGVCGSYASNFKCFCDRDCHLNGDCCDDYVAECACACPVGQYRTDGTCLQVNRSTADFADLCSDCTAELEVGYYFSSSGGLMDSCEISACKSCSAGRYRANCGGVSMGTCESCPAVPEGLHYVSSDNVFNCSVAGCDPSSCPGGTFLDGCGTGTAGSCQTCIEPTSNLSYFVVGSTANPYTAEDIQNNTNLTCTYTTCLEAEEVRCGVGQYLDDCGSVPVNVSGTNGTWHTSSTQAACLGDYSANGVCYYFQSEAATFEDAVATCASMGGHVAFTNDDATLAALSERAGTAPWWLGLVGERNCSFSSIDESSNEVFDSEGANWNPAGRRRHLQEPNNCTECNGTFTSQGECCVEVYGSVYYGLWNDIACSNTNDYFCAVRLNSAGTCRNCTTIEDAGLNSSFQYVSTGHLSNACDFELADTGFATTPATTIGAVTSFVSETSAATAAHNISYDFVVDWQNSTTFEHGIRAFLGDNVYFMLADDQKCQDEYPTFCADWAAFCDDPEQAWVVDSCPETCGKCTVSNVILASDEDAYLKCSSSQSVELAQAVPFVLQTETLGVGTFYILDTANTIGCPMPRFELTILLCPDNDSDVICDSVDSCLRDVLNDADSDLLCLEVDSCPFDEWNDFDSDEICGDLDSCPDDVDNDQDGDGICESVDSCSNDADNDMDSDAICSSSDVCPEDSLNDGDSDGICDSVDSCLFDPGNDEDNDGVCDGVDTCLDDSENDIDSDRLCASNDICPFDPENDGDSDIVCDGVDSCPHDSNNDVDDDGICDSLDSCPNDGLNDGDSDGVCDGVDSCWRDALNDLDGDGLCDSVDSCPHDIDNDSDSDTLCSVVDSCPTDFENDADSDSLCADEDSCPGDRENDIDSDATCGNLDSCPADAENDSDSDALCLHQDVCPNDPTNDEDSDSVCDLVDSCLKDADNDSDSDSICDVADDCPHDPENDADSDGICALSDICPSDPLNDGDSDSICDSSDSCRSDARNDGDSDGICDGKDRCPQDQSNDSDSDGICASDDACPNDPLNDGDSDGICDSIDSCPLDSFNDADSDNICDGVDSCLSDAFNDLDSDNICSSIDICPRDKLNDMDSDAICDSVDSCLWDPFNDADGDGRCGDVSCVNVRHYSELQHCEVVFGDVDLTVNLRLGDNVSDIAISLPQLIFGNVRLIFDCPASEGLTCRNASLSADGTVVHGNVTFEGAASNVTVRNCVINGNVLLQRIANASATSLALHNVTANAIAVHNVSVTSLNTLQVVRAVIRGSAGLRVSQLRFDVAGAFLIQVCMYALRIVVVGVACVCSPLTKSQ